MINDDIEGRLKEGYSITPILGFDPTYGFLLGGAYFQENPELPGSKLDLLAFGTFKPVVEVYARYQRWNIGRSRYEIKGSISNFFDSYYGEGVTNPNNQIEIKAFNAYLIPSYWYRVDDKISLGVFSELRIRNELGTEANENARFFRDEFTPVIGVAARLDYRDNLGDPTSGSFHELKVDFSLKDLTSNLGTTNLISQPNARDFLQAEWDSRFYLKVSDPLLLSSQIKGGISAGTPSYLYRFSLGGVDNLRGIRSNRLRGKHYYQVQGQARFALNHWLALAGFGGLGDVADQNFNDFTSPVASGGVGIRLGLPPDFIAKARFDFAWSKDESTFSLNFNEAF